MKIKEILKNKWGWIGAVILLINWILTIFPDKVLSQGCVSAMIIGKFWNAVCFLTSHDTATGLFSLGGSIILGFLLGWGITILWRKLK